MSVVVPGEEPLLFDLGTGLRYYGLSLRDGEPFRGSCLLSHLHWDHVQGLPFFSPLLDPASSLTVYGPSEDDGTTAAEILAETIRPPVFPIGIDGLPGRVEVRETGSRFTIGGFDVTSARVPHVGVAVGYRVRHGDTTIAYLSDHQQPVGPSATTVPDGVRRVCEDVDLLIHDAEYTPAEFARRSTWGHCTVEYAVWLAGEVGARRLALFHHDPSHDDDMIDRLAAAAAGCGKDMGVEVFAAREGLVVEVGGS